MCWRRAGSAGPAARNSRSNWSRRATPISSRRRDGEDTMSTEDMTLPLVAGPDPAALADDSPDWLATLRRSAAARYGQLGLPGPRTEAWRFTGLNAVKALRPVPAAGS